MARKLRKDGKPDKRAKNRGDGKPDPPRDKILGALTIYAATGSYIPVERECGISKTTIHRWTRNYPEILAEAYEIAKKIRTNAVVQIITKIEDRTLNILDDKTKEIPFNQLMIGGGIYHDKYFKYAGIADRKEHSHKGEITHEHKVFERYIQVKEQAKKELENDSSNRIKKAL